METKMMSTTEDLRTLGTADVAELLGVAERTLMNWRSLRNGPRYIKIGRRVRYRPADLKRYLRECTVEVAA